LGTAQWDVLQRIGSGAFAKVFSVKERPRAGADELTEARLLAAKYAAAIRARL